MSKQLDGRGYSPEAPDERLENFACPQLSQSPRKKKNITKNKRRFSDEQIRLLESIFESETKLEPRKKLQLAGDLGLQPRQIAIWFQNRRARWKSKRIEQEYKTLRAKYDNLASCFESLKNERQSLLIQLQKLNELLDETCDGNRTCKGSEGNNNLLASNNGNINNDPKAQQRLYDTEFMCSQNNKSRDIEHSGDERHELLNHQEYTDSSLASHNQWCSFDSGSQFDLSSSSSQWFNFWI